MQLVAPGRVHLVGSQERVRVADVLALDQDFHPVVGDQRAVLVQVAVTGQASREKSGVGFVPHQPGHHAEPKRRDRPGEPFSFHAVRPPAVPAADRDAVAATPVPSALKTEPQDHGRQPVVIRGEPGVALDAPDRAVQARAVEPLAGVDAPRKYFRNTR